MSRITTFGSLRRPRPTPTATSRAASTTRTRPRSLPSTVAKMVERTTASRAMTRASRNKFGPMRQGQGRARREGQARGPGHLVRLLQAGAPRQVPQAARQGLEGTEARVGKNKQNIDAEAAAHLEAAVKEFGEISRRPRSSDARHGPSDPGSSPRRTATLRERARGPWRIAVAEASMSPAIADGDSLVEAILVAGHAAFFGTGAYVTAILQVRYGVNAWLGFGVGIFVRRGARRRHRGADISLGLTQVILRAGHARIRRSAAHHRQRRADHRRGRRHADQPRPGCPRVQFQSRAVVLLGHYRIGRGIARHHAVDQASSARRMVDRRARK